MSAPSRAGGAPRCAALMLCLLAAMAGAATPELTLEAAVEQALEGNPGLAEIRARAAALAAVPDQAGALPDPRVYIGAANFPTDTFDFDQEPMTQAQFGVSQTFPFPGKLALRERIAELASDVARHEVEELKLELVADVRTLWWELAFLAQSAQIVEQNQRLMRELIEIARAKYEVGRGLQQDVLLAQLELSKLHDIAIRIDGQRAAAYARLGALLDWPPGTAPPLPTTIAATLPALLPESVLHDGADGRPLLAALAARVAAAQSQVDLAQRDLYPDLDVSAGYGLRGGNAPTGGGRADFASLRMSVSVPLFAERKQRRAVDQRRAELLASRHALSDARARVRAAIEMARAEFERARRSAALFADGIIPQARQTVAAMLAAYQVNEVDFLNVARAEITLYDYEMQYWQAVADAHKALARLVAAVGSEEVVR